MQLQVSSSVSWQDEFRNALKSTTELASFMGSKIPKQPYPVFIPIHFAKKIKEAGDNSPLWKQFVPSLEEKKLNGYHDPIGDKVHAKNDGIIHRYKNRILFSPTTICPVHCRYCFRKNELSIKEDFLKSNLESLIDYLIQNPCVEEVILTGGDPLIISNEKLENILLKISKINTVKYLRLHTRTPIIIPSRIDKGLVDLLARFNAHFDTLSVAIHVNHSEEICSDVKESIFKLSRLGLNLLSQSVLLKDVNDDLESLMSLFKATNKLGIRPYYLHHPDQALGAMHFYLPLEVGRKLYAKLRNQLPGWMIPHYVIDSPMAHGKSLAFNPENYKFSNQFIDRFGQEQPYFEPS